MAHRRSALAQLPDYEYSESMQFLGTFSGAPREDPEAYLDEIEAYAEVHVQGYGKYVQGKGAAKAVAQAVKTSAFLQGLGDAVRVHWYWDLPARDRDWETLQMLFRKQFRVFPPRVSDRRVARYARQRGEGLRAFLGRAQALAALCNPGQAVTVRDTLYTSLDKGGDRHDGLVVWLVDARLNNLGMLGEEGALKDVCTLDTVIEAVAKTLDSAELVRMLRDPDDPRTRHSSVGAQYAQSVEVDEEPVAQPWNLASHFEDAA